MSKVSQQNVKFIVGPACLPPKQASQFKMADITCLPFTHSLPPALCSLTTGKRSRERSGKVFIAISYRSSDILITLNQKYWSWMTYLSNVSLSQLLKCLNHFKIPNIYDQLLSLSLDYELWFCRLTVLGKTPEPQHGSSGNQIWTAVRSPSRR